MNAKEQNYEKALQIWRQNLNKRIREARPQIIMGEMKEAQKKVINRQPLSEREEKMIRLHNQLGLADGAKYAIKLGL